MWLLALDGSCYALRTRTYRSLSYLRLTCGSSEFILRFGIELKRLFLSVLENRKISHEIRGICRFLLPINSTDLQRASIFWLLARDMSSKIVVDILLTVGRKCFFHTCVEFVVVDSFRIQSRFFSLYFAFGHLDQFQEPFWVLTHSLFRVHHSEYFELRVTFAWRQMRPF